ncbi:MAG: HD domain-containing protein [Candidatus Hodarchaeales archaeon]
MTSLPNYKECINFLLQQKTPFNVIDHAINTTQTAMEIAERLKILFPDLNCNIVLSGAMLHDIGRSKSHYINHGIIGAEILKTNRYPDCLANIAENHIFAGITKKEAPRFGLPKRDFIPKTLEEKIIAYSDNISKRGTRLNTEQVIKRFSKYLEPNDPVLERVKDLHHEIEMYLSKSTR